MFALRSERKASVKFTAAISKEQQKELRLDTHGRIEIVVEYKSASFYGPNEYRAGGIIKEGLGDRLKGQHFMLYRNNKTKAGQMDALLGT